MSGLREIASFYDPEEAQIAAGFLRANNVDAILGDHNALTAMPYLRVAYGGYRVLVPTESAEEARALAETTKIAEDENPACRACGGKKFVRAETWLLSGVLFLALGQLLPFARNTPYLQCSSYGTRINWNEAMERAT